MANCTCYPAVRDGMAYNTFIAEYFGECLYSQREVASFIVGMSSLGFWIACQLPQFVKNYQRKSGGALSKWFLLEWFLGDALNLAGALLTHQLSTQIATGILFIINDTLMISQLTYYSFRGKPAARGDGHHRRQLSRGGSGPEPRYEALVEDDEEDGSAIGSTAAEAGSQVGVAGGGRAFQPSVLAALAVPLAVTVVNSNSKWTGAPPADAAGDFGFLAAAQGLGRVPSCEPHESVSKSVQTVGMAIGWISSAVYLNSRIPQILKNQRRRSVEGLSILMFGAAVMGNTTYGLGVMLRDPSWKALHKALPWLVGSLGTLVLDFTILMQFWCFADGDREAREVSDSMASVDSLTASRDDAGSSALLGAMRRSPDMRGLFGMKAWNSSPFFKPLAARGRMPPLDLRDATSLGVLPSETAERRLTPRPVSNSDAHAASLRGRSDSVD